MLNKGQGEAQSAKRALDHWTVSNSNMEKSKWWSLVQGCEETCH